METNLKPLLKSLKKRYPHIALTLQAHQAIMDNYTPEHIAERLKGLPVDYILFDASQSRGIPYDLTVMRKYVAAIYQHRIPIGVVVSGGLGTPKAMRQIFAPLIQEFSELSCDAFLKLYDTAKDTLAWPSVEQYLTEGGAYGFKPKQTARM
jgi:hypothetical protein